QSDEVSLNPFEIPVENDLISFGSVIREIQKINQKELDLGLSESASWHSTYKDSAYVYAGGLPFQMTEGDIIAVFAQYGEIVDVNLIRDKETGKSKGYAFLAYEDQRSTNLAVDNFNGQNACLLKKKKKKNSRKNKVSHSEKIADRIIRVDHVRQYKSQKTKTEEEQDKLMEEQIRKAKAILPGHLRDDLTDDETSGLKRVLF
ncbi:hypothetical protein HK096_004207, partial [Nowakowskiella sp. JEL0078]